jgi:hypothetical protein
MSEFIAIGISGMPTGQNEPALNQLTGSPNYWAGIRQYQESSIVSNAQVSFLGSKRDQDRS